MVTVFVRTENSRWCSGVELPPDQCDRWVRHPTNNNVEPRRATDLGSAGRLCCYGAGQIILSGNGYVSELNEE
jgi:hypothetical protein